MFKLSRMRWIKHVACLAKSKVVCKICLVKLKTGDPWRSRHR